MNLGKILIIEDDENINKLIAKILVTEGYIVDSAYSGTEGKMCLNFSNYDLIILDLMLPGIIGESLLKYIRKDKEIPVIVVSAKTSLDDKINVLDIGADDYLTKPFEINELKARVNSQLRRYKHFGNKNDNIIELKYKDLVLDLESLKATLSNTEIPLTSKEFSILKLLVENPKKVFTREALYEKVWNQPFFGEYNTINVHISNIRSKISNISDKEEYIKTVWGIGFKMVE